jgi:choline dehydrogenase-like flavoprotein
MGGGSSVMGMVAYRGTPDDYAEWEAFGADGWGWNQVLPFYRKLEHDLDFGGDQHGKDGPVPIRRTRPEDWAPLSKAVHVYAQERQVLHRRRQTRISATAYGAVPMSNWPDKRLGGDHISACARARQSDDHQRAMRPAVFEAPRTGVGGNRRRSETVPRARNHPVARQDSFARLPDARASGVRQASAQIMASECAPICQACENPLQPPSCSSASCSAATRGSRTGCGRIP